MSNLYHFDDSMETGADKPTYIEAGIRENIYLKDIVYKTTSNDNEFIALYFTDKPGNKLSHTEWPPRSEQPFEQLSAKEKEDFLKKVNNQKKRLGQIVKTYLPNETFDKKPESFKEYAENIIELLKGKTEDVPVRVKVVYNSKGFTSLPMYSRYKFIEPMTVPAEESKIKILNIDVIVRPTSNVISNVKSKPKLETEKTEVVEPNKEKIPNGLPF